jgi:hypothetical protein
MVPLKILCTNGNQTNKKLDHALVFHMEMAPEILGGAYDRYL